MSPQRITKKEMKQDKFVTYSLKVSEWIQKHLNEVLMGAGGVILVAVVLIFIFTTQAKRQRKAAELLGKARLELQTGNMGQAVNDLQTVLDKYGSTESAGKAAFFLASAFFYAQEYAQAQTFFERYLEKYQEDPLLSASAQAGIGDCHVQRDNFISAGEAYEKAVSMNPKGFLAPQYLLKAASAYIKGDRKDKAKDILNRLINEYPDSREVHQAKMELAEHFG
jgi:outer membrane protein assembly factor BamD (BamD/ComL family)